MRAAMREDNLREQMRKQISERNQFADKILEQKWFKAAGISEGLKDLYNKDKNKARGVGIILENQEAHLQALTETQISNAFQTTPHNVLKVVRLAYPNSVRAEIFLDWPMETARDAIYYLTPVKENTVRDGVANSSVYDTFDARWPDEREEQVIGTGNGALTTFSATLTRAPLRPWSVKVFANGVQIAQDDGAGNLVGTSLSGTNTVNYTSGAIVVTTAVAWANGFAIMAQYNMDSEVLANQTYVASMNLQLRDYQFRVKPMPLYISWSKMTELLLGTTLNIDAEEALVRGAADELRKAIDFFALTLGYRVAKKNTAVNFNASGAVGEAEVLRANALGRFFGKAGNTILDTLNRGGITKVYGGGDFIEYTKLHQRFDASGAQPAIGAHRVGSLDNMDFYKTPNSIVPSLEAVGVYRNPEIPEDVSIAFGTLIPLYKTQTMEFKNMESQMGVSYFGDAVVLNPQYLVPMSVSNLP